MAVIVGCCRDDLKVLWLCFLARASLSELAHQRKNNVHICTQKMMMIVIDEIVLGLGEGSVGCDGGSEFYYSKALWIAQN